jgi:histidine triad (HIT) family protein
MTVASTADAGCIFCRIVSGRAPAEVVLEDSDSIAFLDHRPLFPGHVLLAPRHHVVTLPELETPLLEGFFANAQRLCWAMEQALGAEGSFVAVNNRVSQSVPHLHVHVVPRRRGDGLRGFFWPRHPYADPEHAGQVAESIRRALLEHTGP